jgi:hypothetical protein
MPCCEFQIDADKRRLKIFEQANRDGSGADYDA